MRLKLVKMKIISRYAASVKGGGRWIINGRNGALNETISLILCFTLQC